MVKTLTAIGNSMGILIERPILELLNITKDTQLEIKTDGEALIIRPIKMDKKDRIASAATEIMNAHEETFRKLAQ